MFVVTEELLGFMWRDVVAGSRKDDDDDDDATHERLARSERTATEPAAVPALQVFN